MIKRKKEEENENKWQKCLNSPHCEILRTLSAWTQVRKVCQASIQKAQLSLGRPFLRYTATNRLKLCTENWRQTAAHGYMVSSDSL